MKIDFKDGVQAKSIRFARANYDRKFDPEHSPFEVTDEEWKYLQRFGIFEEAKTRKTSTKKKSETAEAAEEMNNDDSYSTQA
jgi:hypothetical protein